MANLDKIQIDSTTYDIRDNSKVSKTIFTSISDGVVCYFKISNFGSPNSVGDRKIILLLGSRGGESVLVNIAGVDSKTVRADSFRINNKYSKISKLYYSISDNAVYVTLEAWSTLLTVDVLSNNGGNDPIVEKISALPTDALISIPIIPFGIHDTEGIAIGGSQQVLRLNGKNTRPTYNSNDLALKSDIPLTASDVGALSSTGGTISGDTTINGNLTINGNYDIVTVGNDNYGIRPAKANYGQVGSSSYYYYRMYAAKFYGEDFIPRSGTSLKLNNVTIAYNSSTETVTFS